MPPLVIKTSAWTISYMWNTILWFDSKDVNDDGDNDVDDKNTDGCGKKIDAGIYMKTYLI